MQRLWDMARQAEHLLANPTPAVQRRILDLLDVRVQITGWDHCEACAGRGFVAAGFESRTRTAGSTGVICPACLRHRYIPVIRIAGVVPDQPSLEHDQRVANAADYPFQIVASG